MSLENLPDTVTIGETKYYTQAGLAKSLRYSVRTLHRKHARREGPPRITRGRLILYRVDAVNEWLAGGEQGGQRADVRSRRRAK